MLSKYFHCETRVHSVILSLCSVIYSQVSEYRIRAAHPRGAATDNVPDVQQSVSTDHQQDCGGGQETDQHATRVGQSLGGQDQGDEHLHSTLDTLRPRCMDHSLIHDSADLQAGR